MRMFDNATLTCSVLAQHIATREPVDHMGDSTVDGRFRTNCAQSSGAQYQASSISPSIRNSPDVGGIDFPHAYTCGATCMA